MTREEALNKVRQMSLPKETMEILEALAPELAESEDEKIRKALVDFFEKKVEKGFEWYEYGIPNNAILAWLEKQKEYELTEEDKKIIPEALVMLCDDIINHRVHTPIKTDEEGARKIKAFLKTFNRQPHKTMKEWEKQKKQKPAWSEDFEQNIKNLLHDKLTWHSDDGSMSSAVFIDDKTIKDIVTGIWFYVGKEMMKNPNMELLEQEWSEDYREEGIQTRFAFYTYKDDPCTLYLSNVFVEELSRNHGLGSRILKATEKVAETIGATTIRLKVKQDSPANAWYRKNGYGYVAFEDGYDWLEKNLEYMKPNKQEWDEFDEDCLKRTVWYIENPAPSVVKDTNLALWLKSLPGRFNLQPKQKWSEEDDENFKWFDKFFRAESVVVGGKDIPQDKYLWFKSLRPQPKVELTLLDENIIEAAVAFVEQNNHFNYWGGIDKRTVIKALRSLKPHWKPSEQEKGALKTAISVLKEERNFPKAAANLQTILDAFDGKETRKEWKPNDEQMEYLSKAILTLGEEGDCKTAAVLNEMRDDLKKLM